VWDFSRLPSGDPLISDFTNWLDAVNGHGLRPLISFAAHGANPSTATYRTAVQQFVAIHPGITEYTAWNEPNAASTFVSASQAAAYFKALRDVCAGACTVAAGDFSGDRTPGTYYSSYKTAVNALGSSPTLWAYHPYEVVNNSGSDRFDGIRATIRWAPAARGRRCKHCSRRCSRRVWSPAPRAASWTSRRPPPAQSIRAGSRPRAAAVGLVWPRSRLRVEPVGGGVVSGWRRRLHVDRRHV